MREQEAGLENQAVQTKKGQILLIYAGMSAKSEQQNSSLCCFADSRVNIRKTASEDLKGLWRLRRKFWRGGGRLAPAGEDETETGQDLREFEEEIAPARLKA